MEQISNLIIGISAVSQTCKRGAVYGLEIK
jgi:hypothetical protein